MATPSITREKVLAYRQRATYLHSRLPPGRLVEAAFAGLQDRRSEDRMGWSPHNLADRRASDRGTGTRSPRAGASVPAVDRAFDTAGIRVVVRRVGGILWLINARRAFRRAADVSFSRKGT